MTEWRAYIKHAFESSTEEILRIPPEYGGDENGRVSIREDQVLEIHRIEILPPSMQTAMIRLYSEKGEIFSSSFFSLKRYERFNVNRRPLAVVSELHGITNCKLFKNQNIEVRIEGQLVDKV